LLFDKERSCGDGASCVLSLLLLLIFLFWLVSGSSPLVFRMCFVTSSSQWCLSFDLLEKKFPLFIVLADLF
jgi:hypothetical protein